MCDERPPPPPETSTDADDLVVQAKSDRDAFGRLYERHYSEVARYCLRRLFVRAVAEDILSDVFLEVAARLPSFPGRTETDFRRWLFRIATSAINAHLRQTRRRQELWDAAARSGRWTTEQHSPDPAPIPAIDNDAPDWPAVFQALLELEERDRSIVTLRFYSDCSHEEIAAVVDATPGAVRTALSRILARLREKFRLPESAQSRPAAPAAAAATPARLPESDR